VATPSVVVFFNIRSLEFHPITILTRFVIFVLCLETVLLLLLPIVSLFHSLFLLLLSSAVFQHSGFKRTLCGGQWESLSSSSYLTSTGRLGCCSPGTFMAQPNLNPFSKAIACESCSVGRYSSKSDDLSCPYTATTCPGGTFAIEPASCRVPIPDCTPSGWSDRCGIRQAVDTYTTQATIDKYGPIEEWNTSLVTGMSHVFYSESSFNATISAWDVGKVTSMEHSTYTLPHTLFPLHVYFGCFFSLYFPLTLLFLKHY